MPLDANGMSSPTGENFIPEAVRRQSRRSDAIARQIGAANVPAEPDKQPDAEPPKVVEPVGQEPAKQPDPAPVDWEQRYKTLQGKYDTEVPTLQSNVQGLRQVLAMMEQNKPVAKEPVQEAPKPTTVEISDEDVREYGPELIARARQWARAEIEPELNHVRSEMATIRDKFSTVEEKQAAAQERSGRSASMSYLDSDAEVGKIWRQVNADHKFIKWLNQPDEFSGQPRLPVLQAVFGQGDGPRSKAIFVRYLREHTDTQVPTPAADHTSREPVKPTLEDFAAPGRNMTPATPPGAPADKRIWTQTDIRSFYRDVGRGVFATDEARKQRIEQDIINAATEGRVR